MSKEVKLDWTYNESNDEEFTVYRDPNASKIDYGKDYIELYFEVEESLGELLAVLHRDGGNYLGTHGNEKATKDAIAAHYELVKALDEARAERDGYRAALERIASQWAQPARDIALLAIAAGDEKKS